MTRKVEPVFKRYDQNQPMLIPPSYDDLVPANHPVRVVNEVIERIDIRALESSYKGGGTSSYHPRMLLKVVVYGYLRNIYSSRKLEQALNENVHFMWLAGGAKPDHNTIADFRSRRLKDHLKKIFDQVVMLLAEEGAVSLKEVVLDGTKIEANANRYTFVWGKAIKVSRERIERQLRELWGYVERVYQDEEQQPNEPNFEVIDPQAVARTIRTINEALKEKEVDPKVRQKLNYAKKNWPQKLAEYDEKEKILKGRNSYSKTDPDATFMRMKEDHMLNGQLKPGYNVQASTERQYIINYTLGQTTSDTVLLKDHIEEHCRSYGSSPEKLTADAGYGSEENYTFLEEQGVMAFVKYNYFDKEETEERNKNRKNHKQKYPFHADNLHYDAERDTLTCPIGQEMHYTGEKRRRTKGGYLQTYRMYRAQNCQGCPMRGPCHKAEGNRIVQRSPNLDRYKQQVRELLESEEGLEKRKQRWQVEAVFGNIKQNKGFRRFYLRGIEKVNIEIGLLAIAHNLQRFTNKTGH
ncbi:MAG: IS1182 family transposase [Undibacterium sp.]